MRCSGEGDDACDDRPSSVNYPWRMVEMEPPQERTDWETDREVMGRT